MSMLTLCCPGTEAGWLRTLYHPRYQPTPTTVSNAAPNNASMLRMTLPLLVNGPMGALCSPVNACTTGANTPSRATQAAIASPIRSGDGKFDTSSTIRLSPTTTAHRVGEQLLLKQIACAVERERLQIAGDLEIRAPP